MSGRKAYVISKGSSWVVRWTDHNGSKRSKSFGASKTAANKFCAIKTAELVQNIFDIQSRSWGDFLADFRRDRSAGIKPKTVEGYLATAAQYERICQPKTAADFTGRLLSKYVSARMKETGKFGKVSVATINRELRNIKVLARTAAAWKLLREIPDFPRLKEPEVDPSFISINELVEMLSACGAATVPNLPNVATAEWWQALLLFGFTTGWRLSELLALTWGDVADGYAITRADNKGRKESRTAISDDVLAAIQKIRTFAPEVFPWPHHERQLYSHFRAIQEAAGVNKTCRKIHEHTDSCRYYGFHDLRRGFASENASKLNAAQLQNLMRHKSYTTTMRYINMAKQADRDEVLSRISVPKVGGGVDGKAI